MARGRPMKKKGFRGNPKKVDAKHCENFDISLSDPTCKIPEDEKFMKVTDNDYGSESNTPLDAKETSHDLHQNDDNQYENDNYLYDMYQNEGNQYENENYLYDLYQNEDNRYDIYDENDNNSKELETMDTSND